MTSQEQERETLSKKRQGKGMRDGSQRGTKEIFIVWEASYLYSNGAILVPAPAINIDALRIVHHVSVIQTVKQTVQLLSKKCAEMRQLCSFGHVYCRLVKVYRTHHQPVAALGKGHQETQD
jgi:hypothetical protein